ncbi:DsbA family oxidoreductase [Oceaniglobus ichthyenteri]|uniref:DsbA family oxidoreductase n=1 Tax=Oceaniglobus ichthyenteri TaxID=2136177 RepID=UPI000D3A3725|nr:DsbA family oxidoreductase [Oceaniglobus ichthyenteri]
MQNLKLDILSDPICPWCLIGKTWLDRALEQRPNHPFLIEWHPFQLNPDMPTQGMERRAYLEAKFGGKDGAIAVYSQIEQAAKSAGIDIDWSKITRTPNTLNAHRLIHWAGLEGRQTAAKSALMNGYFRQGLDIGDPEVLADIAASIELDREMIARLLASDADVEEIRARDAHTRERGVTGVPTFVIANAHALPGAQSTDMWLKIIDDIAAQSTAENGAPQ